MSIYRFHVEPAVLDFETDVLRSEDGRFRIVEIEDLDRNRASRSHCTYCDGVTMFYSLESLAPQDLFEGYRARIYHGEEITFAVVEIEPHAQLPAHQHRNEQVGLLVRGEITFTIDGEHRTLHAGEGWVIPADAAHDAAAGPEGAIVIETWAPPRADFRELVSGPLSAPMWP
jgi:quercetin dioxygenase-like cupin family protein